MIEQLNQVNNSLNRVNSLLQDGGGDAWPMRFHLLDLPQETPGDGQEFISRAERVAKLTNFLDQKIRPQLERKAEKLKDQFIQSRLEVIQTSVQRRENGGYGLTRDILGKAVHASELIKLPIKEKPSEITTKSPEIQPVPEPIQIEVIPDAPQTPVEQIATLVTSTVIVSPPEVTPIVAKKPEATPTADPKEEARLKTQRGLAKKILLTMADGHIKTLAATPTNFISPFVPLGSDLSTLIGQSKDPLIRDGKIIDFIIQGIKTAIQDVYSKGSRDYSADERSIASALVHISSNNHLDIRTIIGSVYQDIFRLPIPTEYRMPTNPSIETDHNLASTNKLSNKEEKHGPAEAKVASYITTLRHERDQGMEKPSYREESLLEFIDTFEERVIFEDDHFLVINKPAGVASHYGSVHPVGIIEASRYVRRKPLYLAHRLDIDTSGVLMLLKSREAQEPMKAQFSNKERSKMSKVYLALLEGDVDKKGPIQVNVPVAPIVGTTKMRVIDEDTENDVKGQASETIFFPLVVLSNSANQLSTLTDVQIITGRTHQIRVVSAEHLQHPVVGDVMYGRQNGRGIRRSLLHARELTFTHPFKNSTVILAAPIPKDFSDHLLGLDWVKEIDEDRLNGISLHNGHSNKKVPARI